MDTSSADTDLDLTEGLPNHLVYTERHTLGRGRFKEIADSEPKRNCGAATNRVGTVNDPAYSRFKCAS